MENREEEIIKNLNEGMKREQNHLKKEFHTITNKKKIILPSRKILINMVISFQYMTL